MKKSLLVFASFFLFSLFFFLVENEKDKKIDIQPAGKSFFEGLKIIHKKNGGQSWILTAKRADLSKDGSEAHLTDIEMDIKSKELTIYAANGLYNLNSKMISVDGPITAKGKNYSITTQQLHVNSTADLLETDSPVLIESNKFNLEGRGMVIDNNEQKVRILKDVKATFIN